MTPALASAAVMRQPEWHKPVVMLLNARGDHLINLPALRAFSWLYGDNLTLVVREGAYETFFPTLHCGRLIELETEHSADGPEFDPMQLADRLGSFDLFVSLNPWWNGSIARLVEAIAAPSIGFFEDYSIALPLDFDKHSCDLAFDPVRLLAPELQPEGFSQPPELNPRFTALAYSIRGALPKGARLGVLHADSKEEKSWPADRFQALARHLLQQDPSLFLFDLGLNPIWRGKLADEPRLISCRQLVLPAAIALVGFADFFIGVDSCFLHVADLYRIPGVGLFGPTSAGEFGFRFGPHRHVSADTMDAIALETVIEAVANLRGARGASNA